MKDLIKKIKSVKEITQSQFNSIIYDYSKEEVENELDQAGITKDDLSAEEFEELLEAKINETKSFSKGALMASGLFLLLELLG